MLRLLSTLADDPNWRVRHATLLLLPALASTLEADVFTSTFADPRSSFEQRATDPCALIRSDWVRTCAAIAKLPQYGSAWLEQHVMPVLRARHTETKLYQRRAVVLDALATLAPHLSARILDEELLPLALSMAADRVPNLRMLLATALQAAAEYLSVSTLASRVVPALQALEADEDIDVLGAARDATEACLALTGNLERLSLA